LELITVLVIVTLLTTMMIPVVAGIRSRMERANCVNNLRGLYVAASAYVDSIGRWPQVSPQLIKGDPPEYARQWYAALESFQIAPINWVCPTIQRDLGGVDLKSRKGARVDYLATPFDSEPLSPRKYPKQPWFIERGDMHGDGNLLVQANGRLTSLTEIMKEKR
jgi:type II secretory pathway pseudopilin PulG